MDSWLAKLIPEDWAEVLKKEIAQSYFADIVAALEEEKEFFPSKNNIFRALELCPFDKVRVVIIGQDPYHGRGQANGLAFSVSKELSIPSSLKNIFKELFDDVGPSNFKIPKHGCLDSWAKQGILLLNTSLTVRPHEPNSHQQIGWLKFTDSIIKILNNSYVGLIFVFWGKQAQMKQELISFDDHAILKTSHPSGFSCHRGFFGCKHFSRINKLIDDDPIDWNL